MSSMKVVWSLFFLCIDVLKIFFPIISFFCYLFCFVLLFFFVFFFCRWCYFLHKFNKVFSNLENKHCVKSVQIRSFLWSLFSCICAEYGYLRRKSLYSVRIQENKDQKKLRIWTLFRQCKFWIICCFCRLIIKWNLR